MKFSEEVQRVSASLSEADLQTVHYISEHMQEVASLSINDLAYKVHSSRSAISRLSQKLGYRGFSELKFAIQKELEAPRIFQQDSLCHLREEILQVFSLAAQYNYAPLLEKMYEARNIAILPSGAMQVLYARQLNNYLLNVNRPSLVIESPRDMQVFARNLDGRDLAIVISLSGNTPSLTPIIREIKSRGVPLVTICQMGSGELARQADYALYYPYSDPKQGMMGCALELMQMTTNILARKYIEFALNKNA